MFNKKFEQRLRDDPAPFAEYDFELDGAPEETLNDLVSEHVRRWIRDQQVATSTTPAPTAVNTMQNAPLSVLSLVPVALPKRGGRAPKAT